MAPLYFLIVLAFPAGSTQGGASSVHHIEFRNEKACMDARATLNELSGKPVYAICVPNS